MFSSSDDAMLTIRLDEVAGAVRQVGVVAVELKVLDAAEWVSAVPVLMPVDWFHCTV